MPSSLVGGGAVDTGAGARNRGEPCTPAKVDLGPLIRPTGSAMMEP
jgi:hypothetical protein